MGPTTGHDLQDLTKDTKGQSTPNQPKRGPACKPLLSPIDMARFEEDFDPHLAMSYFATSPANLDMLRKELAKAVIDGAKNP
jgi:hypothetical protein